VGIKLVTFMVVTLINLVNINQRV